MKKTQLGICLLSVFSLLGTLSACGKGSGPDSSSTGTKTANVIFWHTFGQGIQNNLEEKIATFEQLVLENDGVVVNVTASYQGNYDTIEDKIIKGIGAGNIPTLTVAYPDHVASYLDQESTRGDYVVNMQPYMDNEEYGLGKEAYLGDQYGEDDFVASFLEEGRQFIVEGTYTLPLMKSSEVLFYNEDAVSYAIKLRDPTFSGTTEDYLSNLSWDEFMELAKYCLDNKDQVWSTMDCPVVYDSDSNLFITKMYQNDIPYSSIDTTTESGIIDFETGEARTKAEAMVTELKADFDAGLFTTKGILGEYGSNEFTEGRSIFSIGSSGGAGYNLPSSDSFTVKMARVPFDNDNPLYVSQGPCLAILKQKGESEQNQLNTLYSWKFLKYLTNAEVNVDLCVRGSEGYIPVRESAFETDQFLDFLVEGEGYAETAMVLLDDIAGDYLNTSVFKGSSKLRDEVGSIITTVLNGDKTVTEAFTDAISATKLVMA